MEELQLIYNVKAWKSLLPNEQCSSTGNTNDIRYYIFSDRIVEIGEWEQGMLEEEKFKIPSIDAKGHILLPGLQDSHIHCAGLGESRYFVNLNGCTSIEELKERVTAHDSPGTWIVGTHWDQDSLGGKYPSRFDLDSIEQPVLLWRACWHIGVLNTKALEACGILNRSGKLYEHFTQPEGGIIDLDNDTGLPTGVLRERAMEIAVAAMGQKSHEERKKFIKEGMAMCVQSGLTAIQTNDESCFSAYRELATVEGLPLRVFLTPTLSEISNKGGEAPELLPFRGRDHDLGDRHLSRLTAERLKIFSDGSLGAETAAIRKVANQSVGFRDKEQRDDTMTGVLIHSTSSLINQISLAIHNKWRLEVHAIGDSSAEQVIFCLEEGYKQQDVDINDSRPVLTHCQVLGSDLIERMAANGIVANVQPSFVPTDMKWVQQRLSQEHLPYAYCWKTLMKHGVVVAGGSDAPIESCNPFSGIHDAMFRMSREDATVFQPQECLSFAEALNLYTVNAAKCAGAAAEKVFGQLEVGFAADMVLVSQDVLIRPESLLEAQPLLVVVGGHIQHESPELRGVRSALASQNRSTLDGPFIPGKNGRRVKRGFLQCDCCRVR